MRRNRSNRIVAVRKSEAAGRKRDGAIKGVVKIYNRHDYAVEKPAALDAWSRRVEEIVTGKAPNNVIRIAEARG